MKIVIWLQPNQNGGGVGYLNSALNILARLYGGVEILGAIVPPGVGLNGIRKLSKEDLKNIDYDLNLVAGENASLVPILKDAEILGIDENKIVLDRTVCIPLFTLEKYNKLRRSKLSILSMNCFAGFLYHRFGLPFLTPTINMFTSDEEVLDFLKNPMQSVKSELKFVRTERNDGLNIDYPVYNIGGAEWNMNHYGDANVAYRKWYERTFKINWLNVLAVMYTENPEILAEFDKLPYSKKVCFVNFETNLDSGFYINPKKYPNSELWQLVNAFAKGKIIEYDIWDMLIYGKKTPLIIK